MTHATTLVAVVTVRRANTILYTDRWAETVAFYRDTLGLRISFENEWFVELEAGGAFVSVADARRSSVAPGEGAGITLSLQVDDVHEARAELAQAEVAVGDVGLRWGADVLDLYDPVGNRVELWSPRSVGP